MDLAAEKGLFIASMPKVSVIIPLYNKGPYIRRALDSVFSQTFTDYEVIVLDDGSTDDGPDKVRAYNDPRLRLIRQANAGPGAARNRGIKEAKGQYVAFLDADDEWLPEYLEQSYRILGTNPECDICISAWYQDYAQGRRLYQRVNILEVYKSIGINIKNGPNDAVFLKYPKQLSMWCTNTVFVKRSIFSKGYQFYGAFRHTYGEDHYLWIQLAFNHSFYQNTVPLAWYHNEASDLAHGGYVIRPLEAFLLWPEPIILNTKPDRKRLVRTWLSQYALHNAHNRLGVGQFDNTIFLLKKFPEMARVEPLSFLFLLLKIGLYKIGLYKPCRK